MEHVVYPLRFGVEKSLTSVISGGETETMTVTFLDTNRDVVKVIFGLDDWAGFQRWVSDHEAEKAKQAEEQKAAVARAMLLAPGGMAPTLKEPKH